MKKLLLLLLPFFVCSIFCNAQAPPRWIWAEGGGSGFGYGVGLKINRDTLLIYGRIGGTLTLGGLTINGGTVPYVGMYDTAGTTNNNGIWLKDNYTNSGFAYADAMALDKEDNTYITSCDGSGNGVYIQRYNRYGTSKWLTDEPNSNCRGYGVAADNRGNVYSAGNFGGYSGGGGSTITFGTFPLTYTGDAWGGYVTKQDTATGTFKWATMISANSGSNNNYIVAGRCATDNEGYVYVAGSYQGIPTFNSIDSPAYNGPAASAASTVNNWGDLFVAKYDSNGNIVWVITAQNAGAPYNSYGYAPQVVVDSCNNVYVAGIFQNTATFGSISVTSGSTTANDYNFYVAKWNALAQQWEWVQTGTNTTDNSPGSLTLDRNSDVYVAGHYSSTPFTIGNVANGNDTTLNSGNTFVAKYANSSGALIWVANATTLGPGGVGVDSLKYVYLSGNMGTSATFGSINVSTSQNGTWLAKLDTFPVRTIVPVVDTSYCPGETVSLHYTITGSFNSGNVFTAQLSNDSGSFISPINIGDTTLSTNGSITITIPPGTAPGSNYLIRVISSSPAGSSYASGCNSYFINNVYINDFYVKIGTGGTINPSISPSDTSVCAGAPVNLTASGGTSYTWSNGDTGTVITIYPTTDSAITLTANGACGSGSITDTVKITLSPPLNIQPPSSSAAATICPGQGVALSVPTSGSGYIWSPSSSLSSSVGDTVIANPTITTVYSVTGTTSGGCISTGTDTITVNPTAPPLNIVPPDTTFCSGQNAILYISGGGSLFIWTPTSGITDTSVTTDSVTVAPIVTTTYTASGLDSAGCAASGSSVVNIIPSPGTPTITQEGDTLFSSAANDNQWYRNDTLIPGATGPYLIITVKGEYFVSVTNEVNGCSTASDSTTGINLISGISDQLSVYPNPFNSNIFIQISSSATDIKDWTMQVTDMLGRTVYSQQSLNYSNEINLSNLSSGMYFITVISKTGRAVFPVVRQN